MNMRDYHAGRARGLELALDIVKKDGIEALEKEVQIRGRTGINSPVSLKDLTVALPPLRRLIQEAYTVLVIETLHTELGFGPKRVNKFMERFCTSTSPPGEKKPFLFMISAPAEFSFLTGE